VRVCVFICMRRSCTAQGSTAAHLARVGAATCSGWAAVRSGAAQGSPVSGGVATCSRWGRSSGTVESSKAAGLARGGAARGWACRKEHVNGIVRVVASR